MRWSGLGCSPDAMMPKLLRGDQISDAAFRPSNAVGELLWGFQFDLHAFLQCMFVLISVQFGNIGRK